MRRLDPIAVVAVVLSVGWALAQVVGHPALTALVVTGSLTAPCLLATRRRRRRSHRVGTALISLVLAGSLLWLLTPAGGEVSSLMKMLAMVAALGILSPVVYAVTFEADGDGP